MGLRQQRSTESALTNDEKAAKSHLTFHDFVPSCTGPIENCKLAFGATDARSNATSSRIGVGNDTADLTDSGRTWKASNTSSPDEYLDEAAVATEQLISVELLSVAALHEVSKSAYDRPWPNGNRG